MQKLLLSCVVCLTLLTACDNDLELTAPWKDIPVIYGVISPADTAHYIRIEKAFLDPAISALEIARIPDSLYYPSLQVELVNTSAGDRFQLTEVNATNEGYPRQDGVFATEPNVLYKVKASQINLTAGDDYRLEVRRSDRLPLVTAEATIVGRPTLTQPVTGSKLRFQYTSPFRVSWLAASNAGFYDVLLVIHYDEFDLGDPSNVSNNALAWKLSAAVTGNETEVLGIEFYEFLRATLVDDPNLRRLFKGIDVQVRSGGEELYQFQRVQLANSGITSAGGDIPQYTNLSEGVGIFSSSNRQTIFDLSLHEQSLDSLRNGYITKDLNFL